MLKLPTRISRALEDVPTVFITGYFISTTGAAAGLLGFTFALLQDIELAGLLGAALATRAVSSFASLAAAGWLVARFNSRRLLIGIEAIYAVTQTLLGGHLLAGGSSIAVVFAATALLGILDGLFIPTNSTFIRSLGQGDSLTRINALMATSSSTSKVVGATTGGILIVALAPAVLLFVSAVAYVLHLFAVLFTRVPNPADAPSSPHSDPLKLERRSALDELRRQPWIVAVTAQATLVNVIAWSPYTVIGPQLSSSLYGGPSAWAGLSAAYGVGAILAGVLLTWKQPRSLLGAVALAFPLWCLPLLGLALRTPLAVVLAGAVLAGFGTSMFNIAWASVLQQRIEHHNLAQVVSWVSIGPQVVAPLGLLVAGTFRTSDGQAMALATGSAAAVAGSVALILLPSVRRFILRERRKR